MKKKICMILVAVFVAVLGTSTFFIINHYKEANKQAELYGELAELVDAAAQTKVRRAKKDFAGALNAIGSLDT